MGGQGDGADGSWEPLLVEVGPRRAVHGGSKGGAAAGSGTIRTVAADAGPLPGALGSAVLSSMVERTLDRFVPDVVWARPLMPSAVLAANARWQPLVVEPSGTELGHAAQTGEPHRQWTRMQEAIAAAEVVAVHQRSWVDLMRRLGVRTRSVELVPPVVDLDHFHPRGPKLEVRHRLQWDRGLVLVLRLPPQPWAAAETVLQALWSLARTGRGDLGVRVILEGAPRELAKLRARANDLGVEHYVTFTGAVPYAQLPSLFRSADLVLECSRADHELRGLLQGMACGLPALVVPSESTPHWVSGDQGLLCTRADAQSVAQGVMTMLDRRDRWPDWGRAARFRIQQECAPLRGLRRRLDLLQRLGAR